VEAEQDFSQQCEEHQTQTDGQGDLSTLHASRILASASAHLAAMTGAQTDRMTRDDGWRLLSIGRHVERLGFLAGALELGLASGSLQTEGGFDAMVALFDSTITFRAQFQQSHELIALLDLLVMDRDNPRSLAWVVHTLRGRLAKLAGSAPTEIGGLGLKLPDPGAWDLAALCATETESASDDDVVVAKEPRLPALSALLQTCRLSAFQVSDDISVTYFTHAAPHEQTGAT
jgi:uncharacterized alpha-E superfamily protein